MIQVSLKDAEHSLAHLIDEAAGGQEVVIARDDGSQFQIVAVASPEPRPRFGSAKGLVKMRDDFEEPIPGFEPYEA